MHHLCVCVWFLCRLGKQASLWHRELVQGVGVVWELQYLAVVMEGTQGVCGSLTHPSHVWCDIFVTFCFNDYAQATIPFK